MLEIVEIIKPAEQGRTTPYLCRGDDEILYYIKGRNAGPRIQASEWVVGHMAQHLGLPVPRFTQANISQTLIDATKQEWRELGSGIAFASEAQTYAQWFEPSYVTEVPIRLRRDILVFDWWIQNMDRFDDNANLLWDSQSKKLVVIDHDLAFEEGEFWPSLFKDNHIFRSEWSNVFTDLVNQAEYQTRLTKALSGWQDACDNLPSAWLGAGYGPPERGAFQPAAALALLQRCLTNDLWRTE